MSRHFILAKLLQDFISIHIGEHDVKENQIGHLLRDRPEEILPVREALDGMPGILQRDALNFLNISVILNNVNLSHVRFRSCKIIDVVFCHRMITVSKVRHSTHRIPEGCKKIDKEMKNLRKAVWRRHRGSVTALQVTW